MERVRRVSAAAIVAGTLLYAGIAQAMTIERFDEMADQDQGEYIGDLVVGAQKVLKDAGHPELAEQVHRLFTEKETPGDKITRGMGEFEINLARARVADVERAGKDPNAPRLEVEHAMIVTLQKNGIALPKASWRSPETSSRSCR